MSSFASPDQNVPLEGENREEEEDNRTQLQKDIESKAGVIPIWPWVDPITGDTKNGVPPQEYANMLLEAKIQNGQPGAIIRCSDPKCERVRGIGTKSMYWRSNESDRTLVPSGWINTGGRGPYIMCPNCRAQDIHDFGLNHDDNYREGVDASTGHSGSTSSGNNKSLPPHTYSRPRNTSKRKREQRPSSKELLKKAGELFKGKIAPDRLKRLEKEIKKEESDKRANAAESRKRRKTSGGKRRRKKRTRRRRKSRRKSRRRMRGKRKGKSRRKKRR